jgi:hypothetical protein
MGTLALGHIFENKLSYINVRKYIDALVDSMNPSNNFKAFLKDIEKEFQQDTQVLNDIKELGHEDLLALNQNIKKFNIDFDKLNNSYYDKNYFGDDELKQLFSSISRQAHRVENISHKYLYLDQTKTQTPDYIKEGLAKLSQEALGKKL